MERAYIYGDSLLKATVPDAATKQKQKVVKKQSFFQRAKTSELMRQQRQF